LSEPLIQSFPVPSMIAKVIRTYKVNLLRHKKCFRDHGPSTTLPAIGWRDPEDGAIREAARAP
jgi:hypothetical protein